MSNADTRQNRSIEVDYEASRPSVDTPLVPGEWTEYRCRRCGEHCINRADGEPTGRELCLDCFAADVAEAAEAREAAADPGRPDADRGASASPLRSVRSSLATVAGRLGVK